MQMFGTKGQVERSGSTRVRVYNTIRNGFSILRLLRPGVEIYTCRRLPYSGTRPLNVCGSAVGGVSPSDRDGCCDPWALTRLSLVPEYQSRTCTEWPTLEGVCAPGNDCRYSGLQVLACPCVWGGRSGGTLGPERIRWITRLCVFGSSEPPPGTWLYVGQAAVSKRVKTRLSNSK